MKSIVRAAFVACLMISAAGTLAPSPVWAEDKLSAKVGKPLNDAVKATQANDFQGALAHVKEAQAVDGRTPFEDYKINTILAYVSIQMKDYATATTATEAAADSPAMPDTDKKEMLHNALLLATQANQYSKAVTYGTQLAAINGLDAITEAMLARAYYESKDFPNAQKYAQMSIDASKAANQPPSEVALDIVMSSQAKQNDQAGAQQTLENLAVNYNRASDWSQLIDVALGGKNVKDADALYLLRLKNMIPDAMRDFDYTSLASAADQQTYSTEAYNVLQKGISSGKITQAKAGALYTHARTQAALDQKELPEATAAAAKSKTGYQAIKLADDYWGYGRFADGEAAARQAISKGGLKDANQAQLLLGMLLTAQGKYDDAVAALGQVTGAHTNTAHLWSVYAQAQKRSQGSSAAQH